MGGWIVAGVEDTPSPGKGRLKCFLYSKKGRSSEKRKGGQQKGQRERGREV